MLSFKELSEKKTKVTLNPKLKDVMEKKGECPECGHTSEMKGCDCDCHKETTKEEHAYVSQEEVSEESTEEVAQTETSLLTFRQFTEGKSLSIDDQMRISKEYNRKSPEEKKAANKKAMGNVKKVAPKKDTRTDAQKMTDATGPRPGSRYRGD